MALSRFLLQIIDRQSGDVIQLEPGLSAETNFVDECVETISKRGVGLGYSTAHVEQDIRAGIEEVILDLKGQIRTNG